MATMAYHPLTSCPSNHAARPGLLARFLTRLRTLAAQWSVREFDRAQLAKWTDRDLHDAGITRADLEYELNKPFWRG